MVWASKLQTQIALSTLEAEYIALSQAMRELLPLRRLMKEIVTELKMEVPDCQLHSKVFEDNNGALGLATSPKLTPRTKHIAVKYHFFRDHISSPGRQNGNGITIHKIDTKDQKADMFTKGLPVDTFKHIRKLVMGW